MFTTATGAAAFTPDDYASLIVQPVQDQSVALQVATTLTTDSTRMHIPIIIDDGGAAWLSEGSEIPIEDAELGEEVVTPAKIAGLRVISSEMAEDSSPAAQKVVGDALARAISLQMDSAFFGNLASPAPKGLEWLGTQTDRPVTRISAGTAFTNLDPFLAAISATEQVGANVTSFVANPTDALTLAQLKEQTGSNVPLLGSDATAPTRRLLAGVPLFTSPAVAPGTVWGLPKDRVMVVINRDVKVDISTDAFFRSDQVAVRGTMRVGFAFPHRAAVTQVSLTA